MDALSRAEKYKKVYFFAENFLKEILNKNGVNISIAKYFNDTRSFNTLEDATRSIIISLCNRQMMPSVIKFTEREDIFKKILYNFNSSLILNNYRDAEHLLKKFSEHFNIKNIQSKSNLWRIFSQGIISASAFMNSFKNKNEFHNFIKTFSLNKYTKSALPMLISKEIKGIGFALACDFLKELGYREYPKPDVHLIAIFYELGLSSSKEPYDVYKSIIEMSEVVNKDAYSVDKLFWLIGSGNLYLDNLNIGRNRNMFIKYAVEKIKN